MKAFFLSVLIAAASAAAAVESLGPRAEAPVRIGYLHGLRMQLLFRTYVDGGFEREGVAVELDSKYLDRPGFRRVPRTYEGMEAMRSARDEGVSFGRGTGLEVVEAMEAGALDGGVVGESSFLSAAARGSPIVAVALLGHYGKKSSGRWLVLRNDVRIGKPDDFKGMTFATRRAGPGDAALLRDYFARLGLDPQKDVSILEQVPDKRLWGLLVEKKVQGILAHFGKKLANPGKWDAYAYKQVDSANPEVTEALLVFRKDFVSSHPDRVRKVVRAYMARILYERSVPEAEKKKEKREGLATTALFDGQDPPEYDYPPFVRMDLLEEARDLLLKYRYLDKKTDLTPYVDRGFVAAVSEDGGGKTP